MRAGLGARASGATAAMILASNLPDADIMMAFESSLAYFALHRGPTHGPLGVVGLGLVAALLVVAWRALRASTRRSAWDGFGTLCGVGIAGTALHVAMDLATSYGIRLLSPFSETWYALDWLPIIDIYLWALLAVGFASAWRRPASRQAIARGVLIAIVAFYGVRAIAHNAALATAAQVNADGAASPCASAPTLTRHPTVFEAAHAGPGHCLQATALPTFLSPLTWRLIRQQSDGYHLREITLGRGAGADVFVPSHHDAWVGRARRTATGQIFFGFSRLPATTSAMRPDGTWRVRAMDVRFVGLPPEGLGPDPKAREPFVMTVEIASDGTVLSERLGN